MHNSLVYMRNGCVGIYILAYCIVSFFFSELSFANGDEISVVGFRDNSGKWRAVSVLRTYKGYND